MNTQQIEYFIISIIISIIIFVLILNIALSLINLNLKSPSKESYDDVKSEWPEQWGKPGKNVIIIDEDKVPSEIKILEAYGDNKGVTISSEVIATINLVKPVKGLKITLENQHIATPWE